MTHAILPTDVAIVCIWKTLVGKDWVDIRSLLETASQGRYSESGIRRALYRAPEGMLERKEELGAWKHRPQVFFRLCDGVEMPQAKSKRSTKKMRDNAGQTPVVINQEALMQYPRWLI